MKQEIKDMLESKKIKTPMGEKSISEFISDFKKLGSTCKLLKKHFPSVWGCLKNQYDLTIFPKKLSENLFDKKLEIMILEDEESRGK